MKITLCSSVSFFDRLPRIKSGLEHCGYQVHLPNIDRDLSIQDPITVEIKQSLIRDHFRKINDSDAIYVANYQKKGIEGYIGGNTFLEIGKAFDRRIPIFIMNNVPRVLIYAEEIEALSPIVIGTNWDLIKKYLPKRNQ